MGEEEWGIRLYNVVVSCAIPFGLKFEICYSTLIHFVEVCVTGYEDWGTNDLNSNRTIWLIEYIPIELYTTVVLYI